MTDPPLIGDILYRDPGALASLIQLDADLLEARVEVLQAEEDLALVNLSLAFPQHAEKMLGGGQHFGHLELWVRERKGEEGRGGGELDQN